MAVAGSQLPVASKSEEPELTCDLHRPEHRIEVGWRCKFFAEPDSRGRGICRNKNGPLFCPTGGRESRILSEAELEQMRVQR